MIGSLRGRIQFRGPDHIVLDVSGVGYVVYCSERTMASLPSVGEAAAVFTDLVVREDLLQLFGFSSTVEREWHKLLLSVQGVGAKGALAIQGTLGTDGLARAITLSDWASVKAAPGVGPKIAQRIVNELKAKAPAIMAMGADDVVIDTGDVAVGELVDEQGPAPVRAAQVSSNRAAKADAMSALLNLGYAQSDAASSVMEAGNDDPDASTQTLIRAALKLLAPKG
jgi:Holliday junction DNA helicase RuvA